MVVADIGGLVGGSLVGGGITLGAGGMQLWLQSPAIDVDRRQRQPFCDQGRESG